MSQLMLANNLLAGLNAEQVQAVTTVDGPVLVIAAPGSGKTRVLTTRLAYLMNEGVAPEQLLAVTFTKKAADEMRCRLERLLGNKQLVARLDICTFNSLGLKLLAGHYGRLGYTTEKPHQLLEATQRAVFDSLLREHRALDIRFEDLAAYISRAKSVLMTPDQVKKISADEAESRIARLYGAYQQKLLKSNLLDFDDQIMLPVRLMQEHSDVREAIQARYSHLLVDEYQDTNRAQDVLLGLLAAPRNNLFVVGDDAQGIYGFRAAQLDNILNYNRHYPGAVRVLLETNYRSAPQIVRLANQLIRHNSGQIAKEIRAARGPEGAQVQQLQANDNFEEAETIAKRVKDLIAAGVPPQEIAVLYRVHAHAAFVAEQLIAEQVPFTIKKSGSFWDQQPIQDMLAYLRLAAAKPHPLADLALETLLRRLGVMADSLGLLKVDAERSGDTLWEACTRVDRIPLPSLQQKNGVKQAIAMALAWRGFRKSVPELYLHVLEQTRMRGELENKRGEGARQKLDCLSALYDQIKRWEPRTLSELFHKVDQQQRPPTNRKQQAVQLLTIHASKGLEWEAVFLIGMEEGSLPYQLAIDDGDLSEERRLCYVAITRAKRYLMVSHARQKSRFGQKKDAMPSRFLAEMAGEATHGVKIAVGTANKLRSIAPT